MVYRDDLDGRCGHGGPAGGAGFGKEMGEVEGVKLGGLVWSL